MRITISVVTLDKIKLTENQSGELQYQFVTLGNGEQKTEGQSVWKITTSVLIMDKIKLNDNQYGGLLFQFCLHNIKMNDEKTLNKIEMSGNQYGEFAPAPVWLITIWVVRITTSVLTPGKIQMTILRISKYVPLLNKIHNEWQSVWRIYYWCQFQHRTR